jgi:hypothetical protein
MTIRPVADCTRHFVDNHNGMYYAHRCMHIGNRFVVEIRSRESGFVVVDYVEDLPNGDVLVEGYDPNPEYVDRIWERLTGYLLAGCPPNKQRSQ